MKVKCINADWINRELTKDKEYEVLEEIGCYYQLKENDKGEQYQCYLKSRFEIVKEENKMKFKVGDKVRVREDLIKGKELREKNKTEKTFREVIADIKEEEVWENKKGVKVYLKNKQLFIDLNQEVTANSFIIQLDEILTLQRKEYTFEEAFKAYEEGKEIESCEGCKFKAIDGDKILIIDYAGDEMQYSNAKEIFSIVEIKGKWYIND